MRTRFFFTVVALTSLTITAPAIATANEYSCANAAAENGYVSAGRYLQQIQQDCAVAYSITSAGGGGAAAVAAAEQYLGGLNTNSPSNKAPSPAIEAPEQKRETTIDDVLVIDTRQIQMDGTSSEVVGGVTVSSLQQVPPSPYYPVTGELYAVNVYVKVGQGSMMINPFFFAARTENGTNLRPTAAGGQEMLPAAEVPAGQQVSGWLTFDVPTGQHIKEVILNDPLGRQLGRWLVP